MADKTTFIKIDRNILHWGWYKEGNTLRVFLHLLLTANIREGKFLGVTIKRGELATSQKSIAESLGISIQSVRTAILHLKSTGEITVSQHPRFSVISIPNYDLYQSQVTGKQQRTNSQPTVNQQQSKNIRKKEETIYTAPPEDTQTKEDYGGVFLSDDEWDELEGLVKNKGEFLQVIDRVGEWLQDNPRPKSKHKSVVKTFLRNDGLI